MDFDDGFSPAMLFAEDFSDRQFTIHLERSIGVFVTDCDNDDSGGRCGASTDFNPWSGSITATYTYESAALPEPSTLLLVSLGLAGLDVGSRRAARSSSLSQRRPRN